MQTTKPTKLRAYIEKSSPPGDAFGRNNKVLVRLAKKSKLSVEFVYRVALGNYNPKPANATALSKATGGAVSAANLAGLE